MGQVNAIPDFILWVLQLGALAMTVFALVHAIRQRPDAFTAVDKLTKPVWIGILSAALIGLLLARTPVGILGIAAIIATGVYLADVRPKVDEIQRGPRW
ncbi:DUF2516 family protein [Nocardia yamanashiensis]|uniref:DUF2516 family protein n=1 Tax=Nocardia yamanashiensis TaxID=209247 RepID=UPI001E54AF8F|nr:DUF2516 family protein [Nocardia yamanashiensis]UGT39297.1 DUF2516 family protein [Nocardia yamanashiensis]